MSRYGWSLNREQSSPYSSMSGGVPVVTNEDFSYITSQDLDDPVLNAPNTRRVPSPSSLEDDILIIKNKGVTYPTRFPAYSIGDGKLRVRDVRERVGLIMDIPERVTKRIRLLYKGKQLKEPTAPVREYGIKNKSELMAVLPDGNSGSNPSDEEMVIVKEPSRDERKSGKRKNKGRKKGRSNKDNEGSATSPPDSNSTLDGPNSPSPATSGAMKKLDELSADFSTKWLPMCVQYTTSPPSDPKKREDEYRRLSESIMQHILLKLDGVETEGIVEVRAKRRDLVHRVQEVLRGLDEAKKST